MPPTLPFLIEFKMPSMLVFVPHQINQIQGMPGQIQIDGLSLINVKIGKRIERVFTRNGGRLDMIGIAVDADGGLRAPVRRNHGGKADIGI